MRNCECGKTPKIRGKGSWWMVVCECGLRGFGNAKPEGAERNWDEGLVDRHDITKVTDEKMR